MGKFLKNVCEGFVVGITIIMIPSIITAIITPWDSKGCYIKNGIGFCDFTLEQMTFQKYECSDWNLCTPYCNCNNCISSEYCNCGEIMCYTYGTYVSSHDNQLHECKFYSDYYAGIDDESYTYTKSHYEINSTHPMYVSKSNNKVCVPKNYAEDAGKFIFNSLVAFIVYGVIFAIFFIVGTISAEFNEENYQYNETEQIISVDNVNEEMIVNEPNDITEQNNMVEQKKYKIVNKYDSDTCCICLEKIDKEKPYAMLECLHANHIECIDNWLQKNKINKQICPTCMSEV